MDNEQEYIYNCSVCNAEVDADAEICPQCGTDLHYILKPENSDNPFNTERVGGWLLFLCITLTILSPLASISKLGSVLRATPEFVRIYPDLAPWLTAEIIIKVMFIVFSIITGVQLWKKKPAAVKIAKSFFIALFVYVLIDAIIALSLISNHIGFDTYRSIIFASLWYIYLIRSQRVKYTYLLDSGDTRKDERNSDSETDEYESPQHFV